jgi:putative ABC transport system substrate-binding protein
MTVGDPVGIGLVASLDRPGANITGVIQQPVAFNADRLALLQRAIPNARRIAVLANVSSADDPSLIALRDPAATLGLDVQLLPVSSADDLPRAFVAASNESADAMMVLAGSLFTANRSLIVQLAAEHRIPTLYPSRLFIEAGGLMDYAFQEQERGALTAEYVSQILAGADPAELSMTPPPDTELVVNLPAARAIGFQVPGALLTEATVVLP